MAEIAVLATRPPRRPLADPQDDLLDPVDLAALDPDVGVEDRAHIVGQTLAIVDAPRVAGDAIEEALVVARHISNNDADAPAPRPDEDAFVHDSMVGRRRFEGQNRMAIAAAFPEWLS